MCSSMFGAHVLRLLKIWPILTTIRGISVLRGGVYDPNFSTYAFEFIVPLK